MTSIYLASSWKNPYYQNILTGLRDCGHEVYDFRKDGFGWQEVVPDWKSRFHDHPAYLKALQDPRSKEGFQRDFNAMKAASVCVVLTPSGRSAHMEFGWMIGQGKPGYVLLTDPQEWDLMYLLAKRICLRFDELASWLEKEP